MKRRKLLVALVSVALIVLFIGICSHNGAKKYRVNTAYIYGEVFLMKDLDTYSAPSEASVTVNGITYTGTYSKSDQLIDTPFVEHWYEGDGFEFSIREKDGKLSMLRLDRPEMEECAFDEAHGRELADTVAAEFIDVALYQLEESVYEYLTGSSHSTHSCHKYRYCRTVGGIKTADSFTVQIYCNGELESVARAQLGTFENVKSVNIDKEKVKRAVEKRLTELYKYQDGGYSRFEIISEWSLVKTPANQCAVCFVVSPYWKGSDGRDYGDWLTTMLVIVDYEKYNPFKP